MTYDLGYTGTQIDSAIGAVLAAITGGGVLAKTSDIPDIGPIETAIDGKVAKSGDTMTGLLKYSGSTHSGLQLISLTTAQRDVLAAGTYGVGSLIYNTTVARVQRYEVGGWVDTDVFDVRRYGAKGDGVTDDTNAIQVALNAAVAAGGGLVYLPAGTYGVKGSGSASDGGVRVGDNTTLAGAGMGASILKLLASQAGDDLTGIVRTPSGEVTRNVTMRDFTIDGNMAQVADRIIGFFAGVSPSEAITISVASTTATATMVSGSHGLTNGQTYYIFNGDVPGLTGDFVVTVINSTQFSFTVVSGTPSDAVGYTWFYDHAKASIADEDIYAERVEIKNCQAYAFDPHERINRLKFVGCISHDNGPDGDGFTLDGVHDSSLEYCYAYNNARNGINLVTGCNNVSVIGCHAWNNTQYGMASQRGSTLVPRNKFLKFKGCTSRNNTQTGLRMQMCIGHVIEGCNFHENGRYGILMEGCSDCVIDGNVFYDNSQTTNNTYDDIRVTSYTFAADSVTYAALRNNVSHNICNATRANKVKYNINEVNSGGNDNNRFLDNICNGAVTADIIVSGTSSRRVEPGLVTMVDFTAASKTLALSDRGTMQDCNRATTQTVTVPLNATVAFPTDTYIAFERLGAGVLSIVGETGVTINGVAEAGGNESLVSLSTQYTSGYLRKVSTNAWYASGFA